MAREEPEFNPIWHGYYSQFFKNEDIYYLEDFCGKEDIVSQYGINIKKMIWPENEKKNEWIKRVVEDEISELLKIYEYCVFTDIDEIIIPNPDFYPHFYDILTGGNVRCSGYYVFQDKSEKEYSPSLPILRQRSKWSRDILYDKTLILKNSVKFDLGFHSCSPQNDPNPNVFLVHLHYFDTKILLKKLSRTRSWVYNEPTTTSIQNKSGDNYAIGFLDKLIKNSQNIPESIKDKI